MGKMADQNRGTMNARRKYHARQGQDRMIEKALTNIGEIIILIREESNGNEAVCV